MSKLAHSNDEAMAQIERRCAIESGNEDLLPENDEIAGISIQRLAKVAAERAARHTGVSAEALQDSIFHSLRDVVGWKLFDRSEA